MKISDMFKKDKIVVSFEIFPPKAQYPVSTIYDTIQSLKVLNPEFISVTYGAGGSSSATTFEIAKKVKNDYDLETLTHFTCIGASSDEIENSLEKIKKINVNNILALRGDSPSNQGDSSLSNSKYRYAKDLVTHIKKNHDFCVGGAAYPEGHLDCRDLETTIDHLKQKVNCGTDFLITQIFFDNRVYYEFLDKVQKNGIDIPISVGIMPILNANQIQRICSLCGASIPSKMQTMIEKYGGNSPDMEKAGIEYACEQISDLVDHNVDGIHIYTMNKPNQVNIIIKQTGLR
ncbi:MAG: methylenetetrahydrofolate reductase [NAD(P)H] [Sporomusaceae bacterium]|nr:methylenetetrahydrofolate reductase [NAD(P)H] [Sporomusaceae bacterium]